MQRPEDRIKEIKSLLDRLQLPLSPQAGAGSQLAANPYYQQWSEYRAQMAAADHRRGQARGRGSVNPWFFVLATALNTTIAAVLAVLITLSVVRPGPPREFDPHAPGRLATDTRSAPTPKTFAMTTEAVPGFGRPLEMEPIGSPERPLRLEVLKRSRLPLHVQPEEALAEPFILMISGLPQKTEVHGAERIGADSWLLPPNAIASLQITMPEWSASLIEIGVELRRTSGAVAARTRGWISVPPPAMPQATGKIDQAAVKDLVQRADQLLSRGDIVAARAVYERAAEMGSAQAALVLGSTFDPNRLWSLGVFGMVGNKDRARQWYSRADQLGHPNAKERLKSLAE
ncbi:MAG TPA: hypothetical protein VJ740_10370 [Hyphomicrobiaceae bacterium]|nr:hypothetical protein [Hyphomicrobiaceae bacterium]